MPITPAVERPVVRDAIPEGEPLNEAEQKKMQRAIMGPAGLIKSDAVLPEGQQPAPALRGEERRKAREANQARARGRLAARSASRLTLEERVERAAKKVNGQNVAAALYTIEHATPYEREVLLLAEEYLGQNRKGVLQRHAKAVKAKTREAFLQAVGASPDEPAEE